MAARPETKFPKLEKAIPRYDRLSKTIESKVQNYNTLHPDDQHKLLIELDDYLPKIDKLNREIKELVNEI